MRGWWEGGGWWVVGEGWWVVGWWRWVVVGDGAPPPMINTRALAVDDPVRLPAPGRNWPMANLFFSLLRYLPI